MPNSCNALELQRGIHTTLLQESSQSCTIEGLKGTTRKQLLSPFHHLLFRFTFSKDVSRHEFPLAVETEVVHHYLQEHADRGLIQARKPDCRD
jgi:hypothetical protein